MMGNDTTHVESRETLESSLDRIYGKVNVISEHLGIALPVSEKVPNPGSKIDSRNLTAREIEEELGRIIEELYKL